MDAAADFHNLLQLLRISETVDKLDFFCFQYQCGVGQNAKDRQLPTRILAIAQNISA
jgi:hypothetical protein